MWPFTMQIRQTDNWTQAFADAPFSILKYCCGGITFGGTKVITYHVISWWKSPSQQLGNYIKDFVMEFWESQHFLLETKQKTPLSCCNFISYRCTFMLYDYFSSESFCQ